jgi:hypothetical protein
MRLAFVALAALGASTACSAVERPAPEPRPEAAPLRPEPAPVRPEPPPLPPEPTSESPGAPDTKPQPDPPKPRPVVLREGSMEAPLFTDEVGKVRAAAVRVLEANEVLPVEVLSDARLATLRAVARAGKLRAGGKKCAAPPTEDDVILTAHPRALTAAFSLLCGGTQCNSDLVVVPFHARLRTAGTPPLLEAGATPSDPSIERQQLGAGDRVRRQQTKGG